MTFCQNCGASLKPGEPGMPGSPACPRCGKSAAAAVQPYQQPRPIYPGQSPYPAWQQPACPAAPAWQQKPAPSGTNSYAILGFAMAWMPIPFTWLVLCILGLIQCGQSGQKGKGFAIAGILLRVLGIIAIIAGIALWANNAVNSREYYPEYWDWDDGYAYTLLSCLIH